MANTEALTAAVAANVEAVTAAAAHITNTDAQPAIDAAATQIEANTVTLNDAVTPPVAVAPVEEPPVA
jgi:hypothetical protein